MATDWCWCYENPKEAANLIDHFSTRLASLRQTSAELCPECGWSMKFPDDGCMKCETVKLRAENEQLKLALSGKTNCYNNDPELVAEVERLKKHAAMDDREWAALEDRCERAEAELDRLNHWQENYANECQQKEDKLNANIRTLVEYNNEMQLRNKVHHAIHARNKDTINSLEAELAAAKKRSAQETKDMATAIFAARIAGMEEARAIVADQIKEWIGASDEKTNSAYRRAAFLIKARIEEVKNG